MSTVLNMLEYTKILNVPNAVHSIGPLCKLLSSYRETSLVPCHTFKMERFGKSNAKSAGAQPKFFRAD